MAKSRDSEIVEAETHLKAVPWKIEIEYMCFKCSANDMRSGSQPNANSLPLYSYGLSYTLNSTKSSVVIF